MIPKLNKENVWKIFTFRVSQIIAIQDLSLKMMENEFVSIFGPPGRGKSTFLIMVAWLEPIKLGEICIDRKVITGPGLDRDMVFQEYTLIPWLTRRMRTLHL